VIIAGVDPGLAGAVAVYDTSTEDVRAFDLPTHEVKVRSAVRRRADVPGTLTLMSMIAMVFEPVVVIIENPGGLPRQSAAAAFTFGYVCGIVHAGVAAAGLRSHLVAPATWKQKMGLKHCDKRTSLIKASQWLPAGADQWPLKKHDGRAEAALLALYGSRFVEIDDKK